MAADAGGLSLLAPVLDAAIVSRVLATALIVIAITLAVERLGPKIGGALAGLPIVIGPGFFFLLAERGAAFSAEAAAYALLSLSATEAFLLAYCAAAARLPAGASVLAASGAWLGSAYLLSHLPPSPVLGLLLFILAAAGARRAIGRLLRVERLRGPKGGAVLLAVRGLAAGLLVAAVTLAADRLGTGWSGILIAFPVGFAVVSVTIHHRSGRETAIATLHAATLGVGSLAAFSFVLSATVLALSPTIAFASAVAAGMALTGLLAWSSVFPRGAAG